MERGVSKFYSMLGIVIFISLILGCEKTEPLPLQHVKLGLALPEDEFRLQAKHNSTPIPAKMPNFNHLFLTTPLKSIAPERVTFIE